MNVSLAITVSVTWRATIWVTGTSAWRVTGWGTVPVTVCGTISVLVVGTWTVCWTGTMRVCVWVTYVVSGTCRTTCRVPPPDWALGFWPLACALGPAGTSSTTCLIRVTGTWTG